MNKSKSEQRGNARVKTPQRHQIEMHMMSLDQMLRADYLVRTVMKYVDSLDLTELYDQIKATRNRAGRDPIDPRILFSLWFFATLEGENSGRRIAVLTERDLAYMWICGGVSVNYHTVCDFRTEHDPFIMFPATIGRTGQPLATTQRPTERSKSVSSRKSHRAVGSMAIVCKLTILLAI